jgi:DNA-3-methyladenine glycosylase II
MRRRAVSKRSVTTLQTNAPDAELIRQAREHLARNDPAIATLHSVTPEFEWRLRPSGFAGLVKMVVEQQVSVAAANAIWARFEAGLVTVTPETVLGKDEAGLRSFGLSGQKVRYAREIAAAALDFDSLPNLSDEDAVAALTAIKGVGRWTAETYLMFCEGRLDVFPAGDVALQEAVRMADAAPARLNEKSLYARAEGWRPYRGVAAHLLWAYYGMVRRGEIAPPAEKV